MSKLRAPDPTVLGTTFDPRHDDRFVRCPECDGEGVLFECATEDDPEPTCGVCLGDRYITRHLDLPAAQAGWFIDHSSYRHNCPRCTGPEVTA